uniref:Uncharacterized protein n=1 Tax=Anopheles atroparvus TaxID=41427 RepID=A0AAG5CTC0_ANOAO
MAAATTTASSCVPAIAFFFPFLSFDVFLFFFDSSITARISRSALVTMDSSSFGLLVPNFFFSRPPFATEALASAPFLLAFFDSLGGNGSTISCISSSTGTTVLPALFFFCFLVLRDSSW